jgi:hypothetical protein
MEDRDRRGMGKEEGKGRGNLNCLTFLVLLLVNFLDVALGNIPHQLLPYKARDNDHGTVPIWKKRKEGKGG